MTKYSNWLSSLPKYPFVHLRTKKAELKSKGVNVIDFSIGDPTSPTPDFIIEEAGKAMISYKGAGYPENNGTKEFRQSVCKWFQDRFGVTLNPENEVIPSLGAKESVFAFPNCFSGNTIIVPTPGYPPYYSGALAAGKKVHLVPLYEKNNFLPDLSSIPSDVAKDASIFWINYPNNPTTTLATEKFYKELIAFCKDHDIIIASDECYSEMYKGDAPESILKYSKENIVVFNSLSKRSNMTGWRIGFVAGDSDVVKTFLAGKENMDSGCANFVQHAAVSALKDEEHVRKMRREYDEKRKILTQAIKEANLREGYSDGTFYIWQPIPANMTSVQFAQELLNEEYALVVTPGPALAIDLPDGTNPGEGFVRFALVPTVEDTKIAAKRLVNAIKKII